MLKAVFWDLGGTICRTDGGGKLLGAIRMAKTIKPYCGSYGRTLAKVWLMMTTYQKQRELIKKELRLEELLNMVFEEGVDKKRMAKEINTEALRYTTPMPGVFQAVSAIAGYGLPMALVTDGFYGREFVEGALKKLGVRNNFQAIILSCEVGSGKPNPEVFLAACEEMKVKPNEALFIGDKENRDIIGAAGLGMKTVLVGKRPKRTKPDLHLPNLSQLPARMREYLQTTAS